MAEHQDQELISRLQAEVEGWRGARPWASQAAYRKPAGGVSWQLRPGPRGWVAGLAMGGALLAGGVAAAASGPTGFTLPGTQIHLGAPAAATETPAADGDHGTTPAGKTATDKDGHGDLTSGQHSQSGQHRKNGDHHAHPSPSADDRGDHHGSTPGGEGEDHGQRPSPSPGDQLPEPSSSPDGHSGDDGGSHHGGRGGD